MELEEVSRGERRFGGERFVVSEWERNLGLWDCGGKERLDEMLDVEILLVLTQMSHNGRWHRK